MKVKSWFYPEHKQFVVIWSIVFLKIISCTAFLRCVNIYIMIPYDQRSCAIQSAKQPILEGEIKFKFVNFLIAMLCTDKSFSLDMNCKSPSVKTHTVFCKTVQGFGLLIDWILLKMNVVTYSTFRKANYKFIIDERYNLLSYELKAFGFALASNIFRKMSWG